MNYAREKEKESTLDNEKEEISQKTEKKSQKNKQEKKIRIFEYLV